MSVGEKIKVARKSKNMSQKELAEILQVSETMVSQYERSLRTPKIETIDKIAAAIGVPIRELMENITWEQHKDTNEMKALDRATSAMEGVVAILADIYGKVEEKTVGDSMYYLIGEGENCFALPDDALNKLYDATRSSIPHMVDLLKKPEKQEIQELSKYQGK